MIYKICINSTAAILFSMETVVLKSFFFHYQLFNSLIVKNRKHYTSVIVKHYEIILKKKQLSEFKQTFNTSFFFQIKNIDIYLIGFRWRNSQELSRRYESTTNI